MTVKELLEMEIDKNGELHLDSEKTLLLLRYMSNIEGISQQLESAAVSAQQIIQDVDHMINGVK